MNFKVKKWNSWQVVECLNGDMELIVGVSAGPRILSLAYRDSKNLLYEDNTGFSVGEWKLYGGHRFTVAPECDASYLPDNGPCRYSIDNGALTVSNLRPDKLLLSMNISAHAGGVYINHQLENKNDKPWSGSLWAITCVPRTALVEGYFDGTIHYLPGTQTGDWVMDKWKAVPANHNFRGKISCNTTKPVLTAAQLNGNLQIDGEEHISGDSKMEIFACNNFIELETVSPEYRVKPGETKQHRQCWMVTGN
ncbi:hypothetical protein [Foetidibacter luteolus]|uniref:hypothetical protein n=1 Tax=Foetidibacter luteolus TaxID=2608880 RepID=UPI00129A4749|nr:hypothetical protein [Foetidibacter luteolus]